MAVHKGRPATAWLKTLGFQGQKAGFFLFKKLSYGFTTMYIRTFAIEIILAIIEQLTCQLIDAIDLWLWGKIRSLTSLT
jgi:hypothetical protein